VFAAWTDPDEFGRWFGTETASVEDVTMDLRVGGEWSARMFLGDGNEISWHGSYLELVPAHRLVLTLSDRPGDLVERVTVDLKAIAEGTEMFFTQSGENMPTENYAQAEMGWRAFFDDLQKLLAR